MAISLLTTVTRLTIYWTLGNFSKPLATINLHISPTLLGSKGVNIFNFSSKIIFGQLLRTFGDFLLVTLLLTKSELTQPHCILQSVDHIR